jgi:hypothetical protein
MDTSTHVHLHQDSSETAYRGEEQHKLDRLHELQAVIASLRTERALEGTSDQSVAVHHSPVD